MATLRQWGGPAASRTKPPKCKDKARVLTPGGSGWIAAQGSGFIIRQGTCPSCIRNSGGKARPWLLPELKGPGPPGAPQKRWAAALGSPGPSSFKPPSWDVQDASESGRREGREHARYFAGIFSQCHPIKSLNSPG